jgi:hypothetical protein
MTEDIEKIRKHFREETSKLDNWLKHRRITEYLPKKEKEVNSPPM